VRNKKCVEYFDRKASYRKQYEESIRIKLNTRNQVSEEIFLFKGLIFTEIVKKFHFFYGI
jgi:hypothetical protein